MSKHFPYYKVGFMLSILCLVLAGLANTTVMVYGQTQSWEQPIRLSAIGQSSWFPDVAADVTGQVHVVWSAAIVGYDTVIYTTSNNGQDWSELNDIAALPQTGGSEATRPTLLVDWQGLLHMSFRSTTVYYSRAPDESAFSAAAWLSPLAVSSGRNVAYFSRMAMDSQGVLHLVYTENATSGSCPICYHVFYRQSNDNGLTWSPPTDISMALTGSAKPQIVIDSQDNLHVVWESGVGGAYGGLLDVTRVSYAASYDGGKNWTLPKDFDEAPDASIAKNIALGLDGGDYLLVAWLGLPDDLIYYQLSADQGRSWSSPQPIPEVWGGWSVYGTRLDDYSMATDSAGAIHLVGVGRTAQNQKSLNVLHLVWDGLAWSKPEVIAALEGDAPEWPRIAIGNGNQLHVVWFVRDEAHIWDSDQAQYQIWYARGMASAPERTPVARATTAPVTESDPTQTPTPPPAASPTPAPVASLSSTPPSSSPPVRTTDETGYLLLIAKALAPVALLVGVVSVTVLVLRRRI